MDETRTIVLSRHGAKILLVRKLAPDQEVTIRCHKTSKESAARVVGQIGEGDEGFYYGVEFLDPEVNVWDIEFPDLAESEKAVGRVLLECMSCHARELTYFNEFEAEVFEANECISRPCKRCTDTRIWKQSLAEEPSVPAAAPAEQPSVPIRSANERKDVRIALKITACIRHAQFGEEIVTTDNVSRAGFSFRSSKRYSQDVGIEVAIPYSEGAINIFAPAKIEHAEHLAAEGVTLYGVSYIAVHKGWPRN